MTLLFTHHDDLFFQTDGSTPSSYFVNNKTDTEDN